MTCAASAFTKNATHVTAMQLMASIDDPCLPDPVVL